MYTTSVKVESDHFEKSGIYTAFGSNLLTLSHTTYWEKWYIYHFCGHHQPFSHTTFRKKWYIYEKKVGDDHKSGVYTTFLKKKVWEKVNRRPPKVVYIPLFSKWSDFTFTEVVYIPLFPFSHTIFMPILYHSKKAKVVHFLLFKTHLLKGYSKSFDTKQVLRFIHVP